MPEGDGWPVRTPPLPVGTPTHDASPAPARHSHKHWRSRRGSSEGVLRTFGRTHGLQIDSREARSKMGGYVYLPASRRNGTLYTGVTANLRRRITQHKVSVTPGFTKKYSVNMLV